MWNKWEVSFVNGKKGVVNAEEVVPVASAVVLLAAKLGCSNKPAVAAAEEELSPAT